MAKLMTILAIFLGFGIAEAQTKEETIEWINTYSGDFLDAKTPENWKYTFSITVDNSGKTIVFVTGSVLGEYFETTKNFDAKNIIRIKLDDKPDKGNGLYYLTVVTQKDAIKEVNKDGTSQRDFLSIYVNSYEDLNRVYKALVHYAGFFGYKEKVAKETF